MGTGDANRRVDDCCPQNRYNRHRLSGASFVAKISLTVDQRAKPILLPVTSHPYDGEAIILSAAIRVQGNRVVGRTQRALTSLVAAIPAGFLAYLLVMVFLSRADSLTMMTQIVVGVTLLCAALVALMPIGLMIFTGKKAKDDDDVVTRPSSRKADVGDDEEVEEAGEIEELEDVAAESDEMSAFEESDADIMADSDAELTGPASSLDEIESIDFDDEEEVKPKKRKK